MNLENGESKRGIIMMGNDVSIFPAVASHKPTLPAPKPPRHPSRPISGNTGGQPFE